MQLTPDKIRELADDYVYRSTGNEWLDLMFNEDARPYYRFLNRVAKYLGPRLIVELGVQTGRSLAHLAKGAPMAKVIGIDPEKWDTIAEIEGKCPNIKFVKDLSQYADLDVLGDLPIDILFIDSEHSLQQVRTELKRYFPRVRDNGLILLDDIHLDGEMELVWREAEGYGQVIDLSHLHVSGFGAILK